MALIPRLINLMLIMFIILVIIIFLVTPIFWTVIGMFMYIMIKYLNFNLIELIELVSSFSNI